MIYVFYNNDPLGDDQGGGAEHFRCIMRSLRRHGKPHMLVGSRMHGDHTVTEDVIYISHTPNFIGYFLMLWLWFLRNRHLLTAHDIFHFHRNYAVWPKFVLCGNIGRTIITYHNQTGKVLRSRLGVYSAPLRAIMMLFERRAVSLADSIVFVSASDREALRSQILLGNYKKSVVIPAAYNSELFQGSGPPNIDLIDRILTLGRITHQKNFELAVDVIMCLRNSGINVTLTIAGDGEGRNVLVRYIRHKGAHEAVKLLGRVEHRFVSQLFRTHGVLLVTSRYEASPTVVKEAIAAQRPVVTTNVGDVTEYIDNKRYGFICGMTPESLAEGVRAARALIQTASYGGTGTSERLSEDNIMSRLLALYEDLTRSD